MNRLISSSRWGAITISESTPVFELRRAPRSSSAQAGNSAIIDSTRRKRRFRKRSLTQRQRSRRNPQPIWQSSAVKQPWQQDPGQSCHQAALQTADRRQTVLTTESRSILSSTGMPDPAIHRAPAEFAAEPLSLDRQEMAGHFRPRWLRRTARMVSTRIAVSRPNSKSPLAAATPPSNRHSAGSRMSPNPSVVNDTSAK